MRYGIIQINLGFEFLSWQYKYQFSLSIYCAHRKGVYFKSWIQ